MNNLKWILALFLLAGLFLAIWFIIRYKIPERLLNQRNTSVFGKKWQNEVQKQDNLYSKARAVVFLGDSHMEQCEWQELFPHYEIANRGIGGETSGALLVRLDGAVKEGTKIVFVQIGINDLLSGIDPKQVLDNFKTLSFRLQEKGVKVVFTLPFYTRYNPEIKVKLQHLNDELKAYFERHGFLYLDLNPKLAPKQELEAQFTSDGVHLNSAGYLLWKEEIAKFLEPAP